MQEEGEKDSNQDPAFVKALLALHDKFVAVVNQQFEKNSLFHKARGGTRVGVYVWVYGCVHPYIYVDLNVTICTPQTPNRR